MADELEEISLSDDSGIGSSTEDLDADNSGWLKTDTLSKKIMETKVATVKGFEETAADATVGRAFKATDDEAIPFTGEVYLAPAEQYWSTLRDRPVKLRMIKSGPGSEPPLTVHQMFQWTVDNYGDHPALCSKKNGPWVALSYKEYQQQCRAAAKSFLKLGLERFHGVGILGFNAPEWFIADIGCIMAGGLATGIYTTNSPEACHYVAHDSEANVLVVEDDNQLDKILQVRHKLPHLKAIVQYKGEVKNKMKNIYSWSEFMKIGKGISDAKLDAVINSQKANECCTIIYTSGTTGNPKGVMLSHDNITWTANAAGSVVNLKKGKDSVVSYLPLSHVAAQMNDMWISMRFAGTTYFAQPDALKASMITVLRDVRPTSFLGVPRVWEQMQEAMKDNSANSSFMKKKFGEWAKRIGLQASYNVMNNNPSVPCGFMLANKLVFKRVRASLGLECCKTCFSGAAPMTKDTLEYFMSLNIPIYELYGMSESTGPHTMSWSDNFRIMSCGKEIPGCKTKVDKPDADGKGELCFWGRHVFMGYMNMADKPEEAMDSKGWLHSGDLGKHDIDDFLYITGRIKELIITAGGENIPLVPIEDAVKKELPIISNAMLVGDKKKSLSMLLTLKCKVDENGDPTDELAPLAVEFCRKHGVMLNKVSEIIRNEEPIIYKVIQEGVDKANAKAMSKAQKVLKWTLLSHDFSVSGGELGEPFLIGKHYVGFYFTGFPKVESIR